MSAGEQWAVSSNNVGSVTRLACSRFNASNGHILSTVQPLECQHLWDTNTYFRWICSLMLVTFDANQIKVASSPIMFWCVNKRPEFVHFHQSKVTEVFSKIFVWKYPWISRMQRQEWTFCGELLLHVKAEKVGVYLTLNILQPHIFLIPSSLFPNIWGPCEKAKCV